MQNNEPIGAFIIASLDKLLWGRLMWVDIGLA